MLILASVISWLMHSDVGEGLRLPVFRLGARQFSLKPAEERILLLSQESQQRTYMIDLFGRQQTTEVHLVVAPDIQIS